MMPPAPRARGVVFDLDGVLVLSEHLWEEAWLDYAHRSGHPWSTDDTRRCQGMSVAEWGGYLADRTTHDPTDAIDTVIGSVARAYDAGQVSLVDGAADLVRVVAARVPVALASSAPRRIIDTVMGALGLGPWFGATVSSSEVAAGKPSPDVYLEAIRRLGVTAAGSLAVEDSSNGIRSATAAGLTVLAVPNPAYPLAPDAAAAADSIHDSLDGVGRRLLSLLDGSMAREEPH
jgi:HAD superfamily hydrolase (TIGR01509 family)